MKYVLFEKSNLLLQKPFQAVYYLELFFLFNIFHAALYFWFVE